MIRRDRNNGRLLISQIEHARLSYELARGWGNDRTQELPLADWLLPAIRDHDDGWFDWEQFPADNDQGLPRSFTEMPANESVEIWSRSIAGCASGPPSSAEALRRLRSGGGEISMEEALALDLLLRGGRRFRREAFVTELAQQVELTEEIATAALTRFEQRGLIRPCGTVLGQEFYEWNLPTVGEAPLAGLWVSEHFQVLARQAFENLTDKNVRAIMQGFLSDQSRRCARWREVAAEFAGGEMERVIDTGLRYLQLFDRMSLWLCMAEREEPWRRRISEDRSFEFRPDTGRMIEIAPWPFAESALELSVSAFDGERNIALPWRLIPGEGDRRSGETGDRVRRT